MHRFDTPNPPTINVEFGAGDVVVDAQDTAETTVELTGGNDQGSQELIAATVIEHRGDTIVVHVPKRGHGLFNRTPDLQLHVTAPHGAALTITSGSADVQARGSFAGSRISTGSGEISVLHLTGSSSLRSGSGEISLDSTEADLDVRSGSGDIRIGSVSAACNIASGSGDVQVQHVAGPAKAQTGSGDISITDAESDVRTQTGSGSVHLGRVHRGEVKAQGASGDVHVGLAAGTAAWLDVHSLTGRVDTDLEAADEPGADEEKVRLRLNTVSGDISVVRV
ncbi:MAG TPA: DUF4097 family beta strand repeat-containing protein [Nocardioidaceae bacterium]|nr:DUF4097 family beta strand repeat-containing protein [Nocardioidaceae bacterium]